MRYFLLILSLIISTAAFAQQQPPDLSYLTKAVGALQSQRNQAMDNAAAMEARGALLADELEKTKNRVKELEKEKTLPSKVEKKD